MQRLCKIQNTALRLITGALKTTPIAAMEIEADVQPLDLFIESVVLKKRIKAHFMPTDAPGKIHRCAAPLSFYQRSKTLLRNRKISLPSKSDPCFVEQAIFNDTPPWDWDPPNSVKSIPTSLSKSQAPEALLQQLYLAVIHEDYEDCTPVYTDGSLDPTTGSAGSGIFFPSENMDIILPLPSCSILNAELLAIQRALQQIKSLPSAMSTESHFVILTDSKSSLQSLESYKPTEYYPQCHSIWKLIREIPAKITFQWIPSHVGIPGNDRADHLAKLAAESGPVNHPTSSVSSLLGDIRKTTRALWCNRWENGLNGRSFFDVQKTPNHVRYQGLSRNNQVNLSRLRMQHFPSQNYLHRFNLVEDPRCLLCGGADESIHHIVFECSALSDQRTFSQQDSWSNILTNTNDEWSSLFKMLDERKRRLHARAMLPDACTNK